MHLKELGADVVCVFMYMHIYEINGILKNLTLTYMNDRTMASSGTYQCYSKPLFSSKNYTIQKCILKKSVFIFSGRGFTYV